MATQPLPAAAFHFERDGAALHVGAAHPILRDLDALAQRQTSERAGIRLTGDAGLRALVAPGSILRALATGHLGRRARAVRAILFDKTPETNWALGWHQDRTIAVAARHEVSGFESWTIKSGILHVEPPFGWIERMVTLRIHLDDTPMENAPLLIAPGSHRCGRIAENAIAGTVARCGVAMCLAGRGDIWVYATPILHASERARLIGRRRVLQVDFSGDDLPTPLEWLGT